MGVLVLIGKRQKQAKPSEDTSQETSVIMSGGGGYKVGDNGK